MSTNRPLELEVRPAAELVQLAGATRPDIARESLKTLARRRDSAASALARDLVLHHADENVRATAAVMLGRDADPATEEALISALHDPNPTVRRRVAQALGRTGGVDALRALESIGPPPDTPVAEAVRTAQTLLSYRIGLTAYLIDPEGTGLDRVRVDRGDEIELGGRLRRSRNSVLADAARELPGFDISPRLLTAFACQGQPGAFVVSRSATAAAESTEGFARPQLVGAMLRDRPCSEHYSLDAYVLTDDRDGTDGKAPHVWLMRPDGTLLHHGRLNVRDETVDFTIRESNAPYSPPIWIEGVLARRSGVITMTAALAGRWRAGATRATVPESRSVQADGLPPSGAQR